MGDSGSSVDAGLSTALLAWERRGTFPKRVKIGPGRVGYRWDDLQAWRDGLQPVEGA
ncbi:MAG: AlpA family phage regulatory protein [Thiothrix sp.]|nr:AlpA family phage regulatory protein [Thiothrix sp.]